MPLPDPRMLGSVIVAANVVSQIKSIPVDDAKQSVCRFVVTGQQGSFSKAAMAEIGEVSSHFLMREEYPSH